jgi:hypothetical protein
LACAALLLVSPAQACDLDGLPGLPGMHRFNPFAARGASVPIGPIARPDARSPQSTPSHRDDSRRSKTRGDAPSDPADDRPKRAWESRDGNGAVSAADKATFI